MTLDFVCLPTEFDQGLGISLEFDKLVSVERVRVSVLHGLLLVHCHEADGRDHCDGLCAQL